MFRITWKTFLLLVTMTLVLPAFVLAAEGGDNVLAVIEGQEITQSEIHEIISGDMIKIERQLHQLTEAAIKNRAQEILTEIEADRRGISKEELLKLEVDNKLADVPAEQVEQFYSSRRMRQPKESVEPQIRQYLAYGKFISGLEKNARIEILTQPFRVNVPVDGPSKGPKTAPVTIVEFGDFECPPCGKAYPVLKKVRENYGDEVRVVFRHFPLSFHDNAQKAGEASMCAADQGKFWEMHDKMFENQKNLGVDGLKSMASQIAELDTGAFGKCLDDGRHADAVQGDIKVGTKVGVTGTPAFFVNGQFTSGALSYDAFAKLIDEELARKKEASGP